jgi:hypothetical protein
MKVYETAEALRGRFNRKQKERAIFLTNVYIRVLEWLTRLPHCLRSS